MLTARAYGGRRRIGRAVDRPSVAGVRIDGRVGSRRTYQRPTTSSRTAAATPPRIAGDSGRPGLALGDAGLRPPDRPARAGVAPRRARSRPDAAAISAASSGRCGSSRCASSRKPEGVGRPLRLARLGDQRADLLVALARLPRRLGGLLLLGPLLRGARLGLGDTGEHRLDARRLRVDLRGRLGALARLGEVAGGEPALGLGELGGEIAGAALGGLVRRLRVANLARQLLQRRRWPDRGASLRRASPAPADTGRRSPARATSRPAPPPAPRARRAAPPRRGARPLRADAVPRPGGGPLLRARRAPRPRPGRGAPRLRRAPRRAPAPRRRAAARSARGCAMALSNRPASHSRRAASISACAARSCCSRASRASSSAWRRRAASASRR